MTDTIADEVAHLSEEQIEELYEKYLSGTKNSELVESYQISINPNKLISVLPPIRSDKCCFYCNQPLYRKRKSKSALLIDNPPLECFNCKHKEYLPNKFGVVQKCSCEKCREKQRIDREAENLRIREIIRKEYCVDDHSVSLYGNLGFTEKLSLLTLFKTQTDERFDSIQSIDDPRKSISLSPTPEMDLELIRGLWENQIILVDPESRAEAFVAEEHYKSFYTRQVQWIVNVSFDGLTRPSLGEIFQTLYNDFLFFVQPQWKDEVFSFLFRLAREEVMQYIEMRAEELGVDFSASNKTREVVTQLLQNFSVSEIYYFAKKAVENAHIYYSKGFSKGKKHAGNTIPGKMLELGERAVNENWNTYKYNRDSRVPRSAISQVFHDLLLQDDDAGFYKSPGKYWEQELYPKHFSSYKEKVDNSAVRCKECESPDVSVRMEDGNIQTECSACGAISEYLNK